MKPLRERNHFHTLKRPMTRDVQLICIKTRLRLFVWAWRTGSKERMYEVVAIMCAVAASAQSIAAIMGAVTCASWAVASSMRAVKVLFGLWNLLCGMF